VWLVALHAFLKIKVNHDHIFEFFLKLLVDNV